VRRIRRRFFFNVAVAQGVVAASVAMAGAILILVLGSQLLDWRWPAVLAVVTFPLAFYRTARRVPSTYRVAQIVDDRLALRDSLSTAIYFSQPTGGREISESMRQAQLAESERIGAQVDPKAAVPLAAPRALYVFAALFLTAGALFTLRYVVESRMDLKKPLARILFDAWGDPFEQRATLKKKQGGKALGNPDRRIGGGPRSAGARQARRGASFCARYCRGPRHDRRGNQRRCRRQVQG